MSSTLTVYQGDTTSVDFFFSRAANKLRALSGSRVPLVGSYLANMAIVINRRMNSLVKCNSSSADNCLFVWTAWMIPWSMECLFAIVLRKRSCVHVHMHTTGDGRDFQPSKCDEALMYVQPTSSSCHSFFKSTLPVQSIDIQSLFLWPNLDLFFFYQVLSKDNLRRQTLPQSRGIST